MGFGLNRTKQVFRARCDSRSGAPSTASHTFPASAWLPLPASRSCRSAGLCEAGSEVLPKYLGKTKGFLRSLGSPPLCPVLPTDPTPQVPETPWLAGLSHVCSVVCPAPSLPWAVTALRDWRCWECLPWEALLPLDFSWVRCLVWVSVARLGRLHPKSYPLLAADSHPGGMGAPSSGALPSSLFLSWGRGAPHTSSTRTPHPDFPGCLETQQGLCGSGCR